MLEVIPRCLLKDSPTTQKLNEDSFVNKIQLELKESQSLGRVLQTVVPQDPSLQCLPLVFHPPHVQIQSYPKPVRVERSNQKADSKMQQLSLEGFKAGRIILISTRLEST